VKIDSSDRLRNLKLNLEYFETIFSDYEIILVEQDKENKLSDVLKGMKNVKHFFLPSKNCHYKTRNLNLATSLATREIVMMLDVDVICHPDSIRVAIDKIKEGLSFVAPYNGLATEIRKEYLTKCKDINDVINNLVYFPKNFNLKLHEFDYSNMHPLYGESFYDNTGGCLIYTKQAFYAIGGWNTNFVSYGFEDMEFVYRLKKLGYQLKRFDDYNIYHFEHKRYTDSYYNNFYHYNEQEWNNVITMSSLELLEYALNGFRKIIFDNQKETIFTNSDSKFSIEVVNSKKIDLSDLTVLIPLCVPERKHLYALEALMIYFEMYFLNYEILMIEGQFRNCRHLGFNKNVKYFWLGTDKFNLNEIIERGLDESSKNIVAIWDFFCLINPKILHNKLKLLSDVNSKCKIKDTNWYLKGATKIKKGVGVTLMKINRDIQE
jgi:hypothetical protein